MLSATLIQPARLNAYGRVWERGVEVPVDLDTARLLAVNPRFEVFGLEEAMEAAEADAKPADEPAQPKGLRIRKVAKAKDTKQEAPAEPDRIVVEPGEDDDTDLTTEGALEV